MVSERRSARRGVVWLGEEPAEWRASNPGVPLVTGLWEVSDPPHEEGPGWDSLDAAINWGREHADEVYIRIGRGSAQAYFSAGTINGSLDGEGFPAWPPSYEDVISSENAPDEPPDPAIAAAVATIRKRIGELRREP